MHRDLEETGGLQTQSKDEPERPTACYDHWHGVRLLKFCTWPPKCSNVLCSSRIWKVNFRKENFKEWPTLEIFKDPAIGLLEPTRILGLPKRENWRQGPDSIVHRREMSWNQIPPLWKENAVSVPWAFFPHISVGFELGKDMMVRATAAILYPQNNKAGSKGQHWDDTVQREVFYGAVKATLQICTPTLALREIINTYFFSIL